MKFHVFYSCVVPEKERIRLWAFEQPIFGRSQILGLVSRHSIEIEEGQIQNLSFTVAFPGASDFLRIGASAAAAWGIRVRQPSADFVLAEIIHRKRSTNLDLISAHVPLSAQPECTVRCLNSHPPQEKTGHNVCIECRSSFGTVRICC